MATMGDSTDSRTASSVAPTSNADAFDGYPYDDEEPEPCHRCEGDGVYHDCGDDACCCADPETTELVICEACRGKGFLR